MKRFISTILFSLITIACLAIGEDSLNAVTMVSYEQGWLDSNGTLALKNNTNSDIHNVTFQITYLSMSGKPLDYHVFSREVDIAPGMTRQIDIPAYEHDRDYSFYKSDAYSISPKRFKIRFELKGYNQENVVDNENDALIDDAQSYKTFAIIAIVLGFLAISFTIGLYVLVVVMAQKRNRSAVLWVFVSLFTTPILAIIILLCIGSSNDGFDDME